MGSAGDAPNERISPRLPSLCFRVSYCPTPRARVRLLGPCFKTGGTLPLCQNQVIERRPCSPSKLEDPDSKLTGPYQPEGTGPVAF